MFSFFKREPAPEGPVTIEAAVEIDRPAADVYPLIDWADPRNSKRELGHQVEPIEGQPDRFRLILTQMPDHCFEMTVIEAVPGQVYAFATDIAPRVGRLEEIEEHYAIEPIDENSCKLTLTTLATFKRGMSMKQFEQETVTMIRACHRGIAKLKVHAEFGVEALAEVERELAA